MIKILIIDDEVDFCFFVKSTLELNLNYRVIIAPNGKAGIKAARREQPDLILLDIMMPGLSGYEVLDKLKNNDKTSSIPIIMLTAKNDRKSIEKAVTSFCTSYIVKPIEMDALQSKIENELSLFGMRRSVAFLH